MCNFSKIFSKFYKPGKRSKIPSLSQVGTRPRDNQETNKTSDCSLPLVKKSYVKHSKSSWCNVTTGEIFLSVLTENKHDLHDILWAHDYVQPIRPQKNLEVSQSEKAGLYFIWLRGVLQENKPRSHLKNWCFSRKQRETGTQKPYILASFVV